MADNNNGFLKGFLFGGAIGAIIALLYAPRSGKETREELKRRSQEFLDDADTHFGNVREQAEHIIENAKKEAEKLRDEAERKIMEAKLKAQELVDTGKSTITYITEDTVGKAHELADKGKGKIKKSTDRVKKAVSEGVKAYKEEVGETDTKNNKKKA
ncbi:MAG: YtxH domain-containing protein [bacterium]